MSRHLYRTLVSSALVATMALSAHAQTSELPDAAHTDADASGIVCGTILFNDGGERQALANTEKNNPALYRRMLERAKETSSRAMLSSDDGVIFNFQMRNRVTGQFDEVPAKLVYQGKRARIWVDVADTARVKAATINALAKGLDSTTTGKSRNTQNSIIENDEEVFGAAPVNRFDNERNCDFLLTDIKDNLNNGFVAGFFSPYDQTDAPGSNKMNILYIDSKEGLQSGVTNVLGTLAHEYQHLIHYNTNNQSEVLFNEGCSEVASILNGYVDRANTGFLKNTNVAMFTWNYEDGTKLLADYERALTFVHYLYEQYGENFLTALNKTKAKGMDRVAGALKTMGSNDNWKDILSAWVAANYLRTFNPPYNYRTRLSSSAPTLSVNAATAGVFADTGSATVLQYASVYNSYTKPGPFKVTFHANLPMRVMAMLYKGTTPVEVWQFEKDSTYQIGGMGTTYDKVVFGIANLHSNAQTIRWEMEKLTLGVEDERTVAAGGLAVNSIVPNPAYGPATVNFTTANAAATTVQIFDARGALVRTLVDGERFEAGPHELAITTDGLSTGAYMVRVSQGSRNASHVLVVTR